MFLFKILNYHVISKRIFSKWKHVKPSSICFFSVQALLLSHTALGETTVGQMINLASNDVSKFDEALTFGQYVWIGPIQTCVITYFLWREIGVSSLPGIIMLIFFIAIQGKYDNDLKLNKE